MFRFSLFPVTLLHTVHVSAMDKWLACILTVVHLNNLILLNVGMDDVTARY